MQFALPACKFEGLQLGHQVFYDFMSLLEAISINVAKEEVKKNYEKDLESLRSRNLEKLYQSLPQQMATLIQSQGTYTNY